MKNFMTIAIGSLCYYIIGYSLMYGTSVGGIIGQAVPRYHGRRRCRIAQRILVLSGCVRRHMRDNCVGCRGRTNEIRRISRVLSRHVYRHLPGHRPLDLGRADGFQAWASQTLQAPRQFMQSAVSQRLSVQSWLVPGTANIHTEARLKQSPATASRLVRSVYCCYGLAGLVSTAAADSTQQPTSGLSPSTPSLPELQVQSVPWR